MVSSRDVTHINSIVLQKTWNGSSRLRQRTCFLLRYTTTSRAATTPLTVLYPLHYGRKIRLGLRFHPDKYISPAPGRTPQCCLFAGRLASPSSIPYPPCPRAVARSRGSFLPSSLPPSPSLPSDSRDTSQWFHDAPAAEI